MIDQIGKTKNLSDFQPLFFLQKADCTIGDNCRVGNWDGQRKPNLQLGHIAIIKFPTDENANSLIDIDQLVVYFQNIRKIIPDQISVIMLPDKVDIQFVRIWD